MDTEILSYNKFQEVLNPYREYCIEVSEVLDNIRALTSEILSITPLTLELPDINRIIEENQLDLDLTTEELLFKIDEMFV
jgi:hypothetical protein